MKHNVVAPSVGESITEVSILKWAKKNGQAVKTGEKLLEIESDKATVEIVAEGSGVLQILKAEGERIPVGTQIGVIDDAATPTVAATQGTAPSSGATGATPRAAASAPAAQTASQFAQGSSAGGFAAAGPAARGASSFPPGMGPAARKAAAEGRLAPVAPVAAGASVSAPAQAKAPAPPYIDRPGDRRVPMSMLRSRIAERLVEAQHTAAILTTFNEVDMGPVMELRNKNKDSFKSKHGVNLGFMSFFARACIEAFKTVPEANGMIDGKDMIYRDYVDLGVAVGTERGLVVPVLRDAHKMTNIQIEKTLADLAVKARDGKLSIADLSGGSFTISNGGVYGSLLSTPILNPPQSAILGMHKIMDRPVAAMDEKGGKVVIRPMMYLALSYDHRLIDGKGAVTYLVTIKDLLEHPEKLGMQF